MKKIFLALAILFSAQTQAAEPSFEETWEFIQKTMTVHSYRQHVGEYDKKAASLAEVESVLDKIIRNKPQTPVLVSGDKDVKYAAVIDLMASLQKSGVINLALLTEPPR